ncbi:MAG: hypothetical protein ACREPF_08535 [Rhodanobacteraceae bacterium]
MNLHSVLARLGGAAMLASMLALAACNANVRRGGETVVNVPQHYDMKLGAFKDNQFMLDGAVLSAPDLEGHFRYLEDQKQLPKTVLLEDTDSAKVNDVDLRVFASLQLTFHFTGYVLRKGKLTLLNAVAAKGAANADENNAGRGQHMHHQPGGFNSGGNSSGG